MTPQTDGVSVITANVVFGTLDGVSHNPMSVSEMFTRRVAEARKGAGHRRAAGDHLVRLALPRDGA